MIKLGQLSDFTDSERMALQKACAIVNACLADDAFIIELGAAKYDNTDDTNPFIIKAITAPMTIMRLYCENLGWMATHWYHTVAKEAPDGTITFNRAFFDEQSATSLANTLFHEACHVAGYSHSSAKDSMSVPYQASDLLEDFAVQNHIEFKI